GARPGVAQGGAGDVGHVWPEQGPGQAYRPHVGLLLDVELLVLDRPARGGHADQVAVLVEGAAAGVAVGDLPVGLDPLLAARLEVLAQPARHQAGGEGNRRAGDARVADDRDAVAGDELVRVAHQHVGEAERGLHGRLVDPLDDLQHREVVRRVAGHVPGPERELGRLVREAGVGHADDVPLVVAAHPEVPDHVVVRQHVAAGADDRPGAGPADEVAGVDVVGDHLDDGSDDVEPDVARQALAGREGCAGPQDGREGRAQHAHGTYLREPDRVLTHGPADGPSGSRGPASWLVTGLRY